MNRNNATILITLLFTAVAAMAQSVDEVTARFNGDMKRLLHGCLSLSHGVANNDVVEVGMAVDSLNSISGLPDVDVLALGSLRVTPIDTTAVVDIKDCFDFSDDYGRKWLDSNGVAPYLENPSSIRGGDECKVLTFRLLPKSSAVYDVRLRGECNMFALSEPNSAVAVTFSSELAEITPVIFEEQNLCCATWTMPRRGLVRITFTNNSDTPATILLASD